jgi:N-acetylmuramoyl-L-alanine amidase
MRAERQAASGAEAFVNVTAEAGPRRTAAAC